MAYFAIEVYVERKKVTFIESSDDDQAFTDFFHGKGEEVLSREIDAQINEVTEISQEDFKNKKIPEKMK